MSTTGPKVKRARNYDAYKGRRQTIPVAPTVKKYVKRCMDRIIDKKYVDGAVTFTNAAAAGTIVADLICGITLGTADTNRVGNTIRVKKIWLRGTWKPDPTNNAQDLRMLCGWDRQPNGAAPTNTTILTQSLPYAPYNHNYVVGHGGSRYEITSDRRLVSNVNASGIGQFYKYTYTWKGNKVVRFGGNAGTVADMVTNNFFVMMTAIDGISDFNGYVTIEYEDA